MLEELRLARRGEHAANLGAFLAYDVAQKTGIPAYVVDPVSVDEWPECARLSGSALLERQCLSHALNSKAVAKRYARECGEPYESLRLIVAHLGSGISVSAHENGLMVDVTNSREEGAFSTERAGGVPAMQLVNLCFSGKYTQKQVEDLLFRDGGLYSYLDTKDLVEVERRIAGGEAKAKTVFEAMVYQIAKEIGAMAAVLHGRVNAVLLTGGMAHSQRLICAADRVRKLDRSCQSLSRRGRTAGPYGRRVASAAPRRAIQNSRARHSEKRAVGDGGMGQRAPLNAGRPRSSSPGFCRGNVLPARQWRNPLLFCETPPSLTRVQCHDRRLRWRPQTSESWASHQSPLPGSSTPVGRPSRRRLLHRSCFPTG